MDMMGIAFIEYKKRTLIAWLSAAIIISGVIYVYKQKNIGIQEAEIRGPGHYATDSSLKFVAVLIVSEECITKLKFYKKLKNIINFTKRSGEDKKRSDKDKRPPSIDPIGFDLIP